MIKTLSKKTNIYHILILALVFRIILAFLPVWHSDLDYHMDWGKRAWDYGLQNIYTANVWSFEWPNQPPGTIYLYAAVYKLFEGVFQFFWLVNLYFPPFPSNIMAYFELNLYATVSKFPLIISDLILGFLIFLYFKTQENDIKKGLLASLIFLFNPLVWYNSTIWGQTDSLVNFLTLASLLLLFKRKLTLAMILFFLSIFIKASLLIYLPIFLILIAYQRYSFKNIVFSIFITIAFIGVITYPFSGSEPYSWIYNLYKDKVFKIQLHLITANAFNIWTPIAHIHATPDTRYLGPLTYQVWGWLLFGLFYLPLIFYFIKNISKQTTLWLLAFTSFTAFTFLTNMHERYLYPLFPIFTILAIKYKKLLPFYIILSAIHLLNLYNFWWVPKIELLMTFMSSFDRIATRILGAFTVLIYLYMYYYFFKNLKLLSNDVKKHIK